MKMGGITHHQTYRDIFDDMIVTERRKAFIRAFYFRLRCQEQLEIARTKPNRRDVRDQVFSWFGLLSIQHFQATGFDQSPGTFRVLMELIDDPVYMAGLLEVPLGETYNTIRKGG